MALTGLRPGHVGTRFDEVQIVDAPACVVWAVECQGAKGPKKTAFHLKGPFVTGMKARAENNIRQGKETQPWP